MKHRPAGIAIQGAEEASDATLEQLLTAPVGGAVTARAARIAGVKIGRIVAIADDGATPLVTYPDQPTSTPVRARATLDLHAPHIGRSVVLMFEDGDPLRPIVIGCIATAGADALGHAGGHVEVTADEERIVVSANEQIVLRCGKASITLTKAGKVIIKGAYVSHRSSGVLRIKGGSVQIN